MIEVMRSLGESLERLSAAAGVIETSAARLEQRETANSGDVQKITAAVDASSRELELERRLLAAEQEIASLHAGAMKAAETAGAVRKTLPTATVQLLAKQGLDGLDTLDTAALDAALSGLTIEQRLAVKSQLLRSGSRIS